jgi:hypothetical protein
MLCHVQNPVQEAPRKRKTLEAKRAVGLVLCPCSPLLSPCALSRVLPMPSPHLPLLNPCASVLFASLNPVQEAPRKRKTLEAKRAVVLDKPEKAAATLLQQLNAIRNAKAEKRRVASNRCVGPSCVVCVCVLRGGVACPATGVCCVCVFVCMERRSHAV